MVAPMVPPGPRRAALLRRRAGGLRGGGEGPPPPAPAAPAAPAEAAEAVLEAAAPAEAVLEAAAPALTVTAGPGGSVEALAAGARDAAGSETVAAAGDLALRAVAGEAATLVAVPAAGYRLAGWTFSGEGAPSACSPRSPANACVLEAGSFGAGATVEAVFEAVPATLTVSAGAGGKVSVAIAGGAAKEAGPESSMDIPFSIEATAALVAVPEPGYRFDAWRGACAALEHRLCALHAGLAGGAVVAAAFAAVPATLTVFAGANGSVTAAVAGASPVELGPGSAQGFPFSAEATASLTAVPAPGRRFAGWALSGRTPPACADGPDANPCELPLGSVRGSGAARAGFAAVTTLTVSAGDRGYVAGSYSWLDLFVGLEANWIIGPGFERGFGLERAAGLLAVPALGWRFAGWALSDGLACALGPPEGYCALEAGSAVGAARAGAVFEALPTTLTVAAGPGGSVAAAVAGAGAATVASGSERDFAFSAAATATLTAAPAAGQRFAAWALSGGLGLDGSRPGGVYEVGQADPVLEQDSYDDYIVVGVPEASPDGGHVDGRAEAVFRDAGTGALEVSAGLNGSVRVAAASGAALATVAAGPPWRFPLDGPDAPPGALQAVPDPGHRFAGWTLSLGSDGADASARAEFEAASGALTLASGPSGSVEVFFAGAGTETVAAGSERGFAFSAVATATFTAVPATGRFFFWLLSTPPGSPWLPLCGDEPFYSSENPCTLEWRLSPDAEARADTPPPAARVEAVFGRPVSLTVAAGPGGDVRLDDIPVPLVAPGVVPPGASMTVPSGSERSLDTLVASARMRPDRPDATLVVGLDPQPAAGHRFARWTLSAGLTCTDVDGQCLLEASESVVAGARAEAVFELASPGALAVAAGAGGSVAAAVAGADAVTVAAGAERRFAFSAAATTTLSATAANNYRFAGWTLSGAPAPACADGPRSNPCAIATGPHQARAEAVFEATRLDLAVAAGPGGSVEAFVSGAAPETVGPGSERGLAFSAAGVATLVAAPAPGYAFAGWTLSGPLAPACASGTAARRVCRLVAGSVTADSRAEAAFEVAPSTLTVAAGANGSVRVLIRYATGKTVAAGFEHGFDFGVEDAATLRAAPEFGHQFTGWTLSGGLSACAAGPATHRVCRLVAGSVTADAMASATFGPGPPAAWLGPGSVSSEGFTHTAVSYAPGAFKNWDGAPCDGSTQPECDVSSVMSGEGLPTAVFHPFVVDGIKSLAFGLGYHGNAPELFQAHLLRQWRRSEGPGPRILGARFGAGAAFGARAPAAVGAWSLQDPGLRPRQMPGGARRMAVSGTA